jgi:hypothetical protein
MGKTTKKKNRKRIYGIARTDKERYVNDYNTSLVSANMSNADVQYIGHIESKLPYYITDYMTKGAKAEFDEMWEEVNNVYKGLGPRAKSFLLNSVKTRQIGAVEVADRFLGTKLYSFSR